MRRQDGVSGSFAAPRVVPISRDEASCLRLVREVAAETHEEWMEGNRYLNTDMLRERLRESKTMVATAG